MQLRGALSCLWLLLARPPHDLGSAVGHAGTGVKPHAGGKARALLRLIEAGFDVPVGFITTVGYCAHRDIA